MSHNGDPGAQVPHVEVQESGGEISMSIEETNRLRISLGLKPLNMEAPQKQSAVDVKKQEQARKEAEQERLAADLRARIEAHKSARQQQSFLAVKGLGEADEDDDMASWVERSRRMAEEQRQKQKQQGGGGTKKTSTSQGRDDDEDEDDGEGYGSKDLAGLKVRHVGMDDLSRGDEVVLTLADRGILDEKGNLQEDEDELENVRIAEERKRKKAREAAAPKAKPLWEEDGKRRGILDKYDEEDDQVMKLDQLNVHDADLRREETRRRLEAAGKILDSADTGGSSTALKIAGDYLTSEEQVR
ncbi:hypothetical protein CEUSTIGMA_g10717.t1 [Chlamydomonas eustigma]|uniref:Uncharacterized protein n=1 Tax=Chlamydomonas eustigma TaxID=1157962 RepID=A0A250XJM3_9CHLO|nr:hypothetical protein CEUSTIGMA_g10717.t1 [Chlamydomonas eustigma]|eukprot:GAX83291.1 hypothetical protein CEUSTIGMA_g10717.t1 [Chlamydomonas eustigma]